MTERILPAVAVPAPARPRVGPGAPARPVVVGAARPATRPTTAHRSQPFLTTPARAGMLFGMSAAVYAVTLAGVSWLQSSSDAALDASRQPYLDAVAAARGANDSAQAVVTEADAQSRALAAFYAAAGDDVAAYEARLESLASLVAEVQGSAAALPTRISLPKVTIRAPIAISRSSSGGRRRGRRPRPPPRVTDIAAANPASSASEEGGDREAIVAFEARALGSALRLFVRLATPSPPDRASRVAADAAWGAVWAEFEAVDLALSRFRDDSELTALNRLAGTAAPLQASWRLRHALAAMHRAARITNGRFDASVLTTLERIGEHGADLGGGQAAPVPREVATAPRPARRLERPALVRVPDVPLDTGGIGKGLALRWAAARAAPLLPGGAALLLEAGGDVVAAGEPPPDGWSIGIEDPMAAGVDAPPIAVLAVGTGAVATSSVGVRNWTAPDGRRVHHLVDPRTHEPARTGPHRGHRRSRRSGLVRGVEQGSVPGGRGDASARRRAPEVSRRGGWTMPAGWA